MSAASSLGRVVLTGASGFLASHLAPALAAAGATPVLLSRKPPLEPAASCGTPIRCGLDDVEALRRVIASHSDGVVYHLAGTRCRGDSHSRFVECVAANLATTMRVLEACKRSGARKVVLLGSAEELGDQPGPQHEDLEPRPMTPYGIVRSAATRLALSMGSEQGLSVVVLRLYSVYGPRQPADMFVAEAVDCAVRGVELRMTEGRQRRDLVFVGDVVRALIAAGLRREAEGRLIHIGSGRPTALRAVAETIWRLSGTTAPLRLGARAAGEAELVDTWADVSRAGKLLGWSPSTDLEAGLGATIEAARSAARGRA